MGQGRGLRQGYLRTWWVRQAQCLVRGDRASGLGSSLSLRLSPGPPLPDSCHRRLSGPGAQHHPSSSLAH